MTHLLKHSKKILIFTVFMVCILFAKNIVYAESPTASYSELDKSLTTFELNEIKDYKDLQNMISQIFELDTEMGTKDLSEPITLMFSLISRILEYWDKEFTKSTLYNLLVGVALIFFGSLTLCNVNNL